MASGLYHADNASPYVRKVAQSFGFQKVSGRMIDAICDQRRSKQARKYPTTDVDLKCGRGTHREGDTCFPSKDACGDGTHFQDGRCVTNPNDHPCEEGTRWNIATGKCHVDCGIHGSWNAERRACIIDNGPTNDDGREIPEK